jgi:hypothetical protein
MKLRSGIVAIFFTFAFIGSVSGQFSLVSTDPQRNSINVPVTKQITLTFSDDVDAASVTNAIFLESKLRGKLPFGVVVSGSLVKITSNIPFLYAEDITLQLTSLKSTSSASLDNPSGFVFKTLNKPSKSVPPNFSALKMMEYPSGGLAALKPQDMDADGDIDFCFVDSGTGLAWLETEANGQYIKHSISPGGGSVADLIPVDIDRDGDMDVVFVSWYDGISIFINDGSQHFAIATTIVGNSISQPDFADFNGDGMIDIVYSGREIVAGNYINGTWIAYNQGGGVFNRVKINGEIQYKLRCADIDNDGDWDVVQTSETLSYLLNTGHAFVSTTIPTPGISISDFSLANMDGDGYVDIILRGDGVRTFLNGGSSQFTAKLILTANDYAASYSVGDYDGDGDVDVVFMDGNYHYVMKVNDGAGNFASTQLTEVLIDLPSTNPSISGDFDGDGDLDFVTTTSNTRLTMFVNTVYPFKGIPVPNNMTTKSGESAWADFDDDGDLDVVTTALVGSVPVTKLFENRNGSFVETNVTLPGFYLSSCDWGDVDNDGDLDILLTGATTFSFDVDGRNGKSLIYVNSNGVFSLMPSSETQLPHVSDGQARFADFDSNGILDIVYNAQGFSGLYQSDGKGTFSKKFEFPAIFQYGKLDVGDYDSDGDLDVTVSGATGSPELEDHGAMLRIFRNDGNWVFTNVAGNFHGRYGGNVSWADLDNDGDLDLFVSGRTLFPGDIGVITAYENQGGSFAAIINSELMYQLNSEGATAVGDFNNDGVPDVVASGYDPVLTILSGDGHNQFTAVKQVLPNVVSRSANWVDFDNDDDLDFFVDLHLMQNNTDVRNTAPVAPASIVVDSIYNNSLYLHWDNGSDVESGPDGISYQLYIGTSPGTQNIVNSNANILTGMRKVSRQGVIKGNRTKIGPLHGGVYYFGVQSIDAAFKGSFFSAQNQKLLIAVNGPSSVCGQVTASYTAEPLGNYTWTVSGGTIVSGQGSNKIDVQWGSVAMGIVRIAGGATSSTFPVYIDKSPQASIVGDNTVCTGVEKYTVKDPLTYFTEWSDSGNHSISGSTKLEANVNWSAAGEFDLILKAYSEHRGCLVNQTLRVSVDKRPLATIGGDAFACVSGTRTYSASISKPEWTVTGGNIFKDVPPTLIVTWPNIGNGTVSLREKSTREYCSTTTIVQVDVRNLPLPPKPTISLVRDTIMVSSPSPNGNYTWYYNWKKVVEGSFNALLSHASGEFVVEVFNGSGCGSMSNPFLYGITGIEDPEMRVGEEAFSIYPNPAHQFVKVSFDDRNAGRLEMEIVSITNMSIARQAYENSDELMLSEIDVSSLASGFYIIRLSTKNKTYTKTFVKR